MKTWLELVEEMLYVYTTTENRAERKALHLQFRRMAAISDRWEKREAELDCTLEELWQLMRDEEEGTC